eukprot:jgi/Tetstr1/464212/TSEL_009017.t1
MNFWSPAKTATLFVKMIRWMFIWMAVRVATRLHEATYVETVYGKKEDPPQFKPLLLNIGVMLLLFHVALLAVVNTLTDSGTFPKSVKTYALTESAAYMVFIMMVSYYMARLVQTKRYFNYRKDGIRAIRAYKELVLWSVFPISVSPIFFTT